MALHPDFPDSHHTILDPDILPVFARHGGWGRANTEFAGELLDFIQQLNEAVAA